MLNLKRLSIVIFFGGIIFNMDTMNEFTDRSKNLDWLGVSSFVGDPDLFKDIY